MLRQIVFTLSVTTIVGALFMGAALYLSDKTVPERDQNAAIAANTVAIDKIGEVTITNEKAISKLPDHTVFVELDDLICIRGLIGIDFDLEPLEALVCGDVVSISKLGDEPKMPPVSDGIHLTR